MKLRSSKTLPKPGVSKIRSSADRSISISPSSRSPASNRSNAVITRSQTRSISAQSQYSAIPNPRSSITPSSRGRGTIARKRITEVNKPPSTPVSRYRSPMTRPGKQPKKKPVAESDDEESNEESDESEDTEEADDEEGDEEATDDESEEAKSGSPKKSVRNQDKDEPGSPFTLGPGSEYFQILLHRKKNLGLVGGSGNSANVSKPLDPRPQPSTRSPPPILKRIEPRPFHPLLQRPPAPPAPVTTVPSMGLRPAISQPVEYPPVKKIQPISCPICFECFTTVDSEMAFEQHIRVYHFRFWMDQTGNRFPFPQQQPPKAPVRLIEKKKREETDMDPDRYIPNCDTIPCRSCAKRGIGCGVAAWYTRGGFRSK